MDLISALYCTVQYLLKLEKMVGFSLTMAVWCWLDGLIVSQEEIHERVLHRDISFLRT
jgi:hypothetical protein